MRCLSFSKDILKQLEQFVLKVDEMGFSKIKRASKASGGLRIDVYKK